MRGHVVRLIDNVRGRRDGRGRYRFAIVESSRANGVRGHWLERALNKHERSRSTSDRLTRCERSLTLGDVHRVSADVPLR